MLLKPATECQSNHLRTGENNYRPLISGGCRASQLAELVETWRDQTCLFRDPGPGAERVFSQAAPLIAHRADSAHLITNEFGRGVFAASFLRGSSGSTRSDDR